MGWETGDAMRREVNKALISKELKAMETRAALLRSKESLAAIIEELEGLVASSKGLGCFDVGYLFEALRNLGAAQSGGVRPQTLVAGQNSGHH